VLDDRGVVVAEPGEKEVEIPEELAISGRGYRCDKCGGEIEVLYWRTESYWQNVNPETGVLGGEEKNEYHEDTVTDMYCKTDPKHIIDEAIQDKIIEENL